MHSAQRTAFISPWRRAAYLVGLFLLAGCASSEVTSQDRYEGELAKPARIVVYDFAATPQDVPANSALAGLYAERETPQSEEEIALGRELGALVGEKLVAELDERGIAAVRAAGGTQPQVGDGVIKGAFVAVDEGSRLQRMLIGFGAGAAELVTLVEGYQQTADGLSPLGSAEVEAAGGKMPGVLAPVGVGAAAGRAATSAVISGAASTVREIDSETLEGAAARTAEEVADVVEEAYRQRGWL